MTVRLGTRGSQLALWQARAVAQRLQERAGVASEIVVIRTSGDEPPDPPSLGLYVPGFGGQVPDTSGTSGTPRTSGTLENVKRLFVKEIETALLDGGIDLAVHSSKDLPVELPDGLRIAATLPREDPRDALLLPGGVRVTDLSALRERLGAGPRLGTSSVRRVAQLRALFPLARVAPIRGNVDTRLRKLDAGECEALVLATAGLKRLGLADRIALSLPVEVAVPAPGQGIVAIEVRNDRPEIARALAAIDDPAASAALAAERAVVSVLGGGCQLPLGVYAAVHDATLHVRAIVLSIDGSRSLHAEAEGPRADAPAVGRDVGTTLLARGASTMLNEARGAT